MKKSILLIGLLMAAMFTSAQTLTKSGEAYLYEGDLISEQEMVSMLQLKCPVAYEQYLTGQKLQKIGRGLWIAGIPTTVTGIGMIVGGAIALYNHYDLAGGLLIGFGAPVVATGISLELANIPLQIVGKHKRNTAYEEYNEKCYPTPSGTLSLNLQSTSDGVGLALRF